MSSRLWHTIELAGACFEVLNLDHPRIVARIMGDMDAGIDVYYDRRWQTAMRLGQFLLNHPEWVAGRSVLVLGAGVGLETVVIGRVCDKLYLNDLAPGALALCAEQLRHNGMTDFVCLPGRYETLELPPVELIVGSFLVYNQDTLIAMRQFLARPTPPLLLVNDNMPALQKLLRTTSRTRTSLESPDNLPCWLFT